MARDPNTADSWLATIATEMTARGIERVDQTIGDRGRRATDARAFLAELGEDGSSLEILDTLAAGGMGIIKLARQLALGREVAVKSLRDDHTDPELAAELLREAWVTGALEHPNIVPVHDIVSDDQGRPQVVMKRIVGESWGELLDSPDRPPRGDLGQLRDDLEILIQVINAIRFAHARGIVHRDLKPANVMIGPFGEVYVVDWGLAVSVDEDAGGGRFPRASEVASRIAGTPAYMAPEMLGGEGAVLDERTDVYLLGAMLYEVMTGSPPHRGANLLEALEHVRDGEPAFPAELPAELVSICRRALARDRDDRHPGAAALLDEIRDFLDHLSSASLAAEAEKPLAELIELLDSERPDRERAYNLFGECRFGFRAALATWPDNPVARRGLERAVSRLVDSEIDRGDGNTALALLADLAEPPPDLLARARQAADAQRHRARRLAELEAADDPRIGLPTRLVLTVVVSLLWTLFPIALELSDIEARLGVARFYDYAAVFQVGWCAFLLAAGFLFREVFGETRFNRMVFWGVFIGAAATALMHFGLGQLGAPIAYAPILPLLVWAVTAAVIAAALDTRIAFIAVAYALAFTASAIAPEWRYWLMAASNFVVALTAVWVWGIADRRDES